MIEIFPRVSVDSVHSEDPSENTLLHAILAIRFVEHYGRNYQLFNK